MGCEPSWEIKHSLAWRHKVEWAPVPSPLGCLQASPSLPQALLGNVTAAIDEQPDHQISRLSMWHWCPWP